MSGRGLVAIGSLIVLLSAGNQVSAQDINIDAKVDRTQVSLGESIELTISVAGPVRSIQNPVLPDLSDFEVYSSGTSSNISIVPGAVSYNTEYSYVLMPRRAGKFTISPVEVEHNGKIYRTKPIEITVVSQSQQQQQQTTPSQPRQKNQETPKKSSDSDDFFIEQVIDRSNPYVGQQVTLIIRVYRAINLYESPQLKLPSLNGFWVEDLPPNKTYNKQVGGRIYLVTEIRKALFPTVTGKLQIEPTVMTIPPQAFVDPFDFFNRRRQRRNISEQVFSSKGITLTVKSLPDSKKPEYFSGAVGTYNFRVTLDKDTVEVDQPIALQAVISGTGNIKKLPSVDIPELENFRLYDSGSNESISKNNYKVTGTKSFEWVLIPTAPGEYTLPELAFSYFDPWSQKYKSSHISPGRVYVKSSSMTALGPGDRPVNVIPAARKSLNYIATSLSTNHSGQAIYQSTWIWLLQILPIAWIIGLSIYVSYRKRLEGDLAYARRKRATAAARAALKEAREGFDSPEQFYGNIFNGIVGFISDKMNINASGMTNSQICELLGRTGRCDNILDDFSDFLKKCDAGRFAPVRPDRNEMKSAYDKAEQLLSELDRSLK